MRKKYKIYERVETSLETKTTSIGYYSYQAQSILFRTFEVSDWKNQGELSAGFDTLEEAEKFIEDNIEDYDNWIILTEYGK